MGWSHATPAPQYPSAAPSLRGSEPAARVPALRSIQMTCPPPSGSGARIAVAALDQPRHHGVGNPTFHLQGPAVGEAARGIEGRLHVEAPVEQTGQQLDMAHGLIVAAHDAERRDRLPVLHQHAGDDRVHRPLAGPTLFGWPPSVRNDRPRLCSSTPLSGARIPEPKPWKIELISDSALPSRSTTQR